MIANPFFIDIEKPQGVLTCYNRVMAVKNGREPLRPALCLDILRATNNFKVVSLLCQVMAEQADDYAAYREAWLGLVAAREVKPDVRETVCAIAKANGDVSGWAKASALGEEVLLAAGERQFARDFRAQGDTVTFHRSFNEGQYGAVWLHEDVSQVELSPICVLPRSFWNLEKYKSLSSIIIGWANVGEAEKISLPKTVKKLQFNNVSGVPESFFDLRRYDALEEVSLRNMAFNKKAIYLPEGIRVADFTASSQFNREFGDLRGYKNLEDVCFDFTEMRKGTEILLPENIRSARFSYATWLHKSFFNLSGYKKLKNIELAQADIRGFLRLPYGIEQARLEALHGLPAKFDLSWYKKLKKLDLQGVHFGEAKEFILPPALEELLLSRSERLPWKTFDLSRQLQLKALALDGVDLSSYSDIKLPPEIETLSVGGNGGPLPETLDLSGYKNLKRLYMAYTTFRTGGKICLPPNLEVLDITNAQCVPPDVADLRKMEHLKTVESEGATLWGGSKLQLPEGIKGKGTGVIYNPVDQKLRKFARGGRW